MKLNDYLYEMRQTPYEFAVEMGISPAAIYRYMNGRVPRFDIARTIEKKTKGKITMEDLRGERK